MKKKILGIIAIFILCATMLCGCFTPLSGIPSSTDAVTGNGGLVVQKGNYLYFVNGYVATSTLVEGDNKGGEENSALYRVKLDDDGEMIYNEDGELQNVERVIDKLAGTDKVGVYIYDNYVYYATPVTQKNNLGTVLFTLTNFCRIKLNGADNEVLYTTNNASDNTSWVVTKVKDGSSTKTVLAVYDGEKIISKVIGGKTYTLESDVTSVVFPCDTDYIAKSAATEESSYVYYTRDAEEDELSYGNVLARRHLLNGEEEIICKDGQNTYSVVDFIDNRYTSSNQQANIQYAGTLYATVTDATVSDATAYYHEYELYSNQTRDLLDTIVASDSQLTYQTYSKILFPQYEGNYSRGAIAQDSNGKIVWIKYNGSSVEYKTFTGMEDDSLTLLAVKGDFAYVVDSSNQVYRINYKNGNSNCILNYDDDADGLGEIDISMTKNVDLDENHIYLFRTYSGNDSESGVYLTRANTVDNQYNVELVGQLETAHKYVVEEDED